MPFPLDVLLEDRDKALNAKRDKPLTIKRDKPIKEALALMIEHDFSQLPIVDEHNKLTGIFSERALARRMYHLQGRVSLFDLGVNHCEEPAVKVAKSEDVDIFEVLTLLKNTYAVVVVEDNEPVGILTDYDTTRYLEIIATDLLIVEDIETSLRRIIEAVFSNEQLLTAALFRAFKADGRDPTKPGKEYKKLDFSSHLQLITEEHNWSRFEGIFEPKDLFNHLMRPVGTIRNQLAHFRGRANSVQHDALVVARDWLAKRPKILAPEQVQRTVVDAPTVERLGKRSGGKYKPLHDWLQEQRDTQSIIRVSFDDIEALLGQPLPVSALENSSWWANDGVSHTQSKAWLQAGWRVEDVDFSLREVVFHRTEIAAQLEETTLQGAEEGKAL